MKTLPDPQLLAYAFARHLREELSDTDMGDVIARNADEPADSSICHSHDFCDANMIMVAAWEELTGQAPDDMANNEPACAVWNQAWSLAKGSKFATS